jgi:diguanylate cyclase (GGDEF)-like protein/PAS domain S-box-containing protein
MNEASYNFIIKNSPIAFAYHEIILDEEGIPCDYVFLEVNHAFEEMTGLIEGRIIGRRVTQVLRGIREEQFDYIASYGRIALQGGTAEYEQYFEELKRWYRIQVYSNEKYYFAVNFLDVSKEKQQVAEYKRMQKSVQENEEQLRRIIDHFPFSLGIIGNDERILYVNREGLKIFEMSEEDINNPEIIYGWIHGEEKHRYMKIMDEEGTVKEFEIQLQTKSGRKFWTRSSGMRIWYENQSCILCTHYDITERRRMEAALRENEEKYRLIFENASETILVVQNDRIQICNSTALKLTGYSYEEINQRPFLDFVQEEDRQYAAEMYHNRLNDKTIAVKPQYRVLRKNGDIAWVEANGVKTTWKGQPAIQYFIVDITEQKKVEDALKASEEKYRLITEFASDMIWVFNYTHYQFSYVSPSVFQILGYLPQEALKLSLRELISQESMQWSEKILPQKIKAFIENPQECHTHVIDMQNIHKDGHLVWVEASSKYRYNAKGEIEILGVSRDIEERKGAEQKVLYLSYHDQLTGLYNRRFYEEELKRLNTARSLPITLVLADVNGLKLTNDAFGHLAGDRLLIRTAEIMKQECRQEDIVARIGGDEFVILLPRTEQQEAESIIGRIKKVLSAEENNNVILSVSFGAAVKKTMEQTLGSVFIEAENAMYRFKLSESSSMRHKTIQLITNALYGKNKEEEKHNKRVGELCRKLAGAAGLHEEEINELETAGFLHDIGKIAMDERLLYKSEPYTEAEWDEVKRHPEKGCQILKASNELAQIAQYVLCHHECMDGTGYPRGIKGEEIPLQARIISIADAYDIMTNRRGYHKRMDEAAAIEEIRNKAGTEFDAELARLFVEKVLQKQWHQKDEG